MTPGTGSEPTPLATMAHIAQIQPKINAAIEPRWSQIVPFFVCFIYLAVFLLSNSKRIMFRYFLFNQAVRANPHQSAA